MLLFFSERFHDFQIFLKETNKATSVSSFIFGYLGSTAYCVIGGAFEISKLKRELADQIVYRLVPKIEPSFAKSLAQLGENLS